MSRAAAIVGVGETDYADDYRAHRDGAPVPDDMLLAQLAFERALADSGLRRQEVDGLNTCFMYGGPDPGEVAAALGITPRHAVARGNTMDTVVPDAVGDIAAGRCDTIALVYVATPHRTRRVFGGTTYGDMGATPTSYYYFTPWGWSSQAAHWAFVAQHYLNTFGATEADLGSVAVALRRHAGRNDNAIMRKPLSIEDYLASRAIVRPLHLLDLCLVNDGAVCLIIRQSQLCADLPHLPVDIAGWGSAEVRANKLHVFVRERLQPLYDEAGRQAFTMAGLRKDDVGLFQGYDASSIHLVTQLEGFGFTPAGTGLDFFAAGHADLGGALPTNTSGGLLSEAYMHGWNHVVEAVRQLRHEAGDRQVAGVGAALFSLATTQTLHPLLLARGSG